MNHFLIRGGFLIYTNMEHLIDYIDYKIVISNEAYLIKPFRTLHENDTSPTKEFFLQQMSYIYFMYSPKSDYSYITDLEERKVEILKQEGLPSNFKESKDLLLAIEYYKKHTTTLSSLLLQDTEIAINKVRKFLRDIDLTAIDDKGRSIYDITKITTAIKQCQELSSSLVGYRQKVEKELTEESRARGGNDSKKIFEDGIIL